jgi:uncharacterized protein (DUF983 family)
MSATPKSSLLGEREFADTVALLAVTVALGAIVAGIVYVAVTSATTGWLVHQVVLLVFALAALLYAHNQRPAAAVESAPRPEVAGTTYQPTP